MSRKRNAEPEVTLDVHSTHEEVKAWLASFLTESDCQELVDRLDAQGQSLYGEVLLCMTEKELKDELEITKFMVHRKIWLRLKEAHRLSASGCPAAAQPVTGAASIALLQQPPPGLQGTAAAAGSTGQALRALGAAAAAAPGPAGAATPVHTELAQAGKAVASPLQPVPGASGWPSTPGLLEPPGQAGLPSGAGPPELAQPRPPLRALPLSQLGNPPAASLAQLGPAADRLGNAAGAATELLQKRLAGGLPSSETRALGQPQQAQPTLPSSQLEAGEAAAGGWCTAGMAGVASASRQPAAGPRSCQLPAMPPIPLPAGQEHPAAAAAAARAPAAAQVARPAPATIVRPAPATHTPPNTASATRDQTPVAIASNVAARAPPPGLELGCITVPLACPAPADLVQLPVTQLTDPAEREAFLAALAGHVVLADDEQWTALCTLCTQLGPWRKHLKVWVSVQQDCLHVTVHLESAVCQVKLSSWQDCKTAQIPELVDLICTIKHLQDTPALDQVTRRYDEAKLLQSDPAYSGVTDWGWTAQDRERVLLAQSNRLRPPPDASIAQRLQGKLAFNLRPYQLQTVAFMLEREASRSASTPLWVELPAANGTPFAFSPVLNALQRRGRRNELRRETGMDTAGGLLALDMGMGKTACAIAAALLNPPSEQWRAQNLKRAAGGRTFAGTLVVMPPTLLEQWVIELRKTVCGRVNMVKWYGNRSKDPLVIAGYDFVLTTPGCLAAMPERMLWHRLIVDEAHSIWQGADQHEIVNTIAKFRWCLSATPARNMQDRDSMWSFLHLGRHVTMNDTAAKLAAVLEAHMIRFTKNGQDANGQAYLELPPLQEQVVQVALSPSEAAQHRSLFRRCVAARRKLASVEDAALDFHFEVNQMRRLCVGASKQAAFLAHLRALRAAQPGAKVLVFSSYCSLLDSIEQCLPAAGFSFRCGRAVMRCDDVLPVGQCNDHPRYSPGSCGQIAKAGEVARCMVDPFMPKHALAILHAALLGTTMLMLNSVCRMMYGGAHMPVCHDGSDHALCHLCRKITGKMSQSQRGAALRAFQADPPTTVFLLSVRTSAVGITLTAASHVYILEPQLDLAVEAQAVGRSYRLGQQRPVTVYHMLASGTIEERIHSAVHPASQPGAGAGAASGSSGRAAASTGEQGCRASLLSAGDLVQLFQQGS